MYIPGKFLYNFPTLVLSYRFYINSIMLPSTFKSRVDTLVTVSYLHLTDKTNTSYLIKYLNHDVIMHTYKTKIYTTSWNSSDMFTNNFVFTLYPPSSQVWSVITCFLCEPFIRHWSSHNPLLFSMVLGLRINWTGRGKGSDQEIV